MFNAFNISKEWNIHKNILPTHVSIVEILTMASPSAQSQLIKQELTRLRQTSSEIKVVKGDKVAVLTIAVDRVMVMVMVIDPTPVTSGMGNDKATSALSTIGGIKKHEGKWRMTCKTCGWNTIHTSGFHNLWAKDLMHFSFLLPTYSRLSPERNSHWRWQRHNCPCHNCSVSYYCYWKHQICYQITQRLRWATHCSVQDRVRGWAIHLFPSQL